MNIPSKFLLGVIGNPISHTASPAMHNAVIKELQLAGHAIEGIYIPIKADLDCETTLIDALINKIPFDEIKCLSTSAEIDSSFRQLPLSGINITIPFKETMLAALNQYKRTHPKSNIQVSEQANVIGAINTLSISESVYATNTDGEGFMEPLNSLKVNLENTQITVLGCGGSAKAIINELIKLNPRKIIVASRNSEKYDQLLIHLTANTTLLRETISKISWVELDSKACHHALKESKLVINTTPLGMAPNTDKSPISQFDWASSGQICYDIIYNPLQSCFLARCKEKGSTIISGSGMLAGQGARAFTVFTGIEVNYKTMEKEVIYYVNSL